MHGHDSHLQLRTLCVHAGEDPRIDGSAVTPIFQSATFLYQGNDAGYDDVRYTRCNNNPSQLVLARKLAALEGTEDALALASGMAAISTTLLTLLSAGDHMLIQASAYGGTYDLVHRDLPVLGITATMVEAAAPPGEWQSALQPNTKVLYVEAISNPLVQVPDLTGLADLARQSGVTSVIDATFASPALLRPAALGYDVVLHSATKYLNGHSDVIAGVVAGRSELIRKIRSKANHLGGCIDPHAAFLLQRGLKTLALRVTAQSATACALARLLQAHALVACVHYPGLPDAPRAALVAELFTGGGAGGMLAFELRGGAQTADAVLQRLQLALVAPSLGGVETLVTLPARTTHVGLTPAQRAAAGITDGLVRVSVGVEDTDDVLHDFKVALDAAAAEQLPPDAAAL